MRFCVTDGLLFYGLLRLFSFAEDRVTGFARQGRTRLGEPLNGSFGPNGLGTSQVTRLSSFTISTFASARFRRCPVVFLKGGKGVTERDFATFCFGTYSRLVGRVIVGDQTRYSTVGFYSVSEKIRGHVYGYTIVNGRRRSFKVPVRPTSEVGTLLGTIRGLRGNFFYVLIQRDNCVTTELVRRGVTRFNSFVCFFAGGNCGIFFEVSFVTCFYKIAICLGLSHDSSFFALSTENGATVHRGFLGPSEVVRLGVRRPRGPRTTIGRSPFLCVWRRPYQQRHLFWQTRVGAT